MLSLITSNNSLLVKELLKYKYPIIKIKKKDIQTKNTSRSLHKIYSPGTYFSSKNEVLSNNIISIWIESYIPFNEINKSKLQIGMSLLNINTGKVLYYQYETENTHIHHLFMTI